MVFKTISTGHTKFTSFPHSGNMILTVPSLSDEYRKYLKRQERLHSGTESISTLSIIPTIDTTVESINKYLNDHTK
jgi:hypothetical protein